MKITKEEFAQMILNGEDISDIDYSHITDMSFMFESAEITYELLEKAKLNTSNVSKTCLRCSSIASNCKQFQN